MKSSRFLLMLMALTALRVLPGCPDDTEQFGNPGGNIAVAPDELDFGTVTLGGPVQSTLVINNAGGGTLTVQSVTLQDGTTGFEVDDQSAILEPADFIEVTVTFTPSELGPAADAVVIVSDDPGEPEFVVPATVVEVVEEPLAEIAWNPSSLEFGAIPTGGSEIRALTVNGEGTLSLILESVTFQEGTTDEFELDADYSSTTLAVGESIDIVVRYTPVDDVADWGFLVIVSNASNEPELVISVNGELAPSPDIEIVPVELQFGEVAVGESATREAEIWNLGDSDLELGTLTLPGLTEFTLDTDPSGLSIVQGGFEVVAVTYTPVDTVPDAGSVEIPSNDPDENPAYLSVGGEYEPRPDIVVDPMSIEFGVVDAGMAVTETVTVSNVGTFDLTVGSPLATGSVEFTVEAAAFPCTIAPGGSEQFDVTYTPLDQISDSGEVTVDSNDPDEMILVVALSGNATPAPDIDLQPTSLDFGQVTVGESDMLDVTLSNLGTAALQLGVLWVDGTSEFTLVTDPSGALLAPGDSVVAEISYAPDGGGTDTAWLEIPSDDPDENPFLLELLGQDALVPNIEVTPPSIEFGQVAVGHAMNGNLLVSNLGTVQLDVLAVYLTGSTDFSVTHAGLPGAVGPGGSRPIHVTYTPTDDVPDGGNVIIVTDDPDEPIVEVELSGENVPLPELDVSPWIVDYGEVKVDQSATGWVTISNTGPGELIIQGCSLPVGPNFWFVSNPGGAVIPSGGSEQLGVSFRPDTVGLFASSITIHNNDLDEPVAIVDLMGAGAEPEVVVTPPSWDFNNVTIGCEETVELEIANAGSVPLTLQGYTFGCSPAGTMSMDSTDLDDYVDNGTDLAAGDAVIAEVSFTPGSIGSFEGAFVLHTDDPALPVVDVFLLGGGGPTGYTQNSFIQDAVSPTDTFSLTTTPLESTVQVFVDGVELTVGWTYDDVLNAVVFYPAFVPAGYAFIDIHYGYLGAC